MLVGECINKVLAEYQQASSEKFAKHPVAKFLRDGFRKTVAEVSGLSDQLLFKGSAGQGQWNKGNSDQPLVPDETTICKFRHLLERHELGRAMLAEVNAHEELANMLEPPANQSPGY